MVLSEPIEKAMFYISFYCLWNADSKYIFFDISDYVSFENHHDFVKTEESRYFLIFFKTEDNKMIDWRRLLYQSIGSDFFIIFTFWNFSTSNFYPILSSTHFTYYRNRNRKIFKTITHLWVKFLSYFNVLLNFLGDKIKVFCFFIFLILKIQKKKVMVKFWGSYYRNLPSWRRVEI